MIYWDDKFSTGVGVIDHDHQALFGLINNVSSAASDSKEMWRVSLAIDALNDYASGHFLREEALMLLCGYTALRRHSVEHEVFRQAVKSLKHLYAVSPAVISIEGLICFLEEWLSNHIVISDHAYVSQMRNHKELVDIASDNLKRASEFGGNDF